MNSFQILDKENNPVQLNELDKIAAEFWGKEVQKKSYASPYKKRKDESNFEFSFRESAGNWFDVLGWAIANQGNYTSGWTNVIMYLTQDLHLKMFKDTKDGSVDLYGFVTKDGQMHLEDEVEEQIYGFLYWVKPYIALANHFNSLGYSPKQIVD